MGDSAHSSTSAARRRTKRQGSTAVSVSSAAEAVERFLVSLGVPQMVLASPDVAATPERVARSWIGDLINGYRMDAAQILGETMAKRGRDLVAVTSIDFHSVCPHHLLPYRGLAHVAYVPNGKVVGFGQLARLVDCFAHRLVIEEDLARQIAEALMTHLGALGAACVLEAEQLCMTVRGQQRRAARAHAQCFVGVLDTEPELQRRFLALTSPSAIPARGQGKRKKRP